MSTNTGRITQVIGSTFDADVDEALQGVEPVQVPEQRRRQEPHGRYDVDDGEPQPDRREHHRHRPMRLDPAHVPVPRPDDLRRDARIAGPDRKAGLQCVATSSDKHRDLE